LYLTVAGLCLEYLSSVLHTQIRACLFTCANQLRDNDQIYAVRSYVLYFKK